MKFADKLRELRDEKKMTEAELAEASNVSKAILHDYLLGRRAVPSFANVLKLAAALGVTCEAFADCEDITGRKPTNRKRGSRK
jgi:transcriptional regulator with XRE-family HTH domain